MSIYKDGSICRPRERAKIFETSEKRKSSPPSASDIMTGKETAPSTSSLEGKAALVTGASRGIGAGIAIQLAKKGLSALAITYVTNKESAEAILAKCRNLGVKKTIAIHADVLDPDIGSKLIPQVLRGLESDTIDIVVNNAALVGLQTLQPFEALTAEAFGKMMQGNCFAPIAIINAALPHLPPRGGRIINISSIASKIANMDPILAYGASKAALDSFTRSLASVYGLKTRATFNSVSVGATATEATQAALDSFGPEVLEEQISVFTTEKRMGEVEDVAFVIAFLASEEARWINGAHIAANGGHRGLLALQG